MNPPRNILVVLGGISGSGKTFLTSLLAEKSGFAVIPSLTTRRPRAGEGGSIDRHFCTLSQFEQLQNENRILCGRHFFGNWYGLDVTMVDAAAARGDAVVQLTYKSVDKFRARYPAAKTIYIEPSSLHLTRETVKARRLAADETVMRLQEIDDEIAFIKRDRNGASPLFDAYFLNERTAKSEAAFIAAIDSLRR